MISFKKHILQEAISYHKDNNIPIWDSVFRYGSEGFFALIEEYRNSVTELSEDERDYLSTDIGTFGIYEGKEVPLDLPMTDDVLDEKWSQKYKSSIDCSHPKGFSQRAHCASVKKKSIKEAEYDGQDVELNKPKRGGPKKFYVYVKNDKGNIIKVTFGDTSGLNAKINNPKARASFAARHKCKERNDKTTASYWACRLPRFAKSLGLSGGGQFFW